MEESASALRKGKKWQENDGVGRPLCDRAAGGVADMQDIDQVTANPIENPEWIPDDRNGANIGAL
jgi:hypothetical protein